eukprot:scaffold2342_cov368-Pinguiococcus_pyrenoidosus.AAC.2
MQRKKSSEGPESVLPEKGSERTDLLALLRRERRRRDAVVGERRPHDKNLEHHELRRAVRGHEERRATKRRRSRGTLACRYARTRHKLR